MTIGSQLGHKTESVPSMSLLRATVLATSTAMPLATSIAASLITTSAITHAASRNRDRKLWS